MCDGSEVWLIAGGGTLYFAFPLLYASSFRGFYLPLNIVLWLLMLRGIPLGADHFFFEPLWTNFRTGADTDILDWSTCGAAVLALVALVVHGALYLALKTEGAVHEKSRKLARRL